MTTETRYRSTFAWIGFAAVGLIGFPISTAPVGWEQHSGYRSAALPLPAEGKIGFTHLSSSDTGIRFTNLLSESRVADNRILNNGSGVALGDVDGDGHCDIYFCR